MTKFEQNVVDSLARIETKLDNDFRTLHGHDSQSGLVDKHEVLENRVLTIETTYKTWVTILGVFVAASTIISALIAFFNYNYQTKELEKYEGARNKSRYGRSSTSRKPEPEASGKREIQRSIADR